MARTGSEHRTLFWGDAVWLCGCVAFMPSMPELSYFDHAPTLRRRVAVLVTNSVCTGT